MEKEEYLKKLSDDVFEFEDEEIKKTHKTTLKLVIRRWTASWAVLSTG